MTSLRTHLDKIRSDAGECMLLSKLAPDGKGEMFAKTAEHLNALAFELEKTIAKSNAHTGTRGDGASERPAGDPEEPVAGNIVTAHHQKAAQPRRMLTWLFVIMLGGIVGFFWSAEPAKRYWSLYALQSKQETSPALQHQSAEAIAALLSAEHAERKILMEQVSALTARVDNLTTITDKLKAAHAEIAGQSNKPTITSEEELPVSKEKSSAAEEKLAIGESLTSTSESLSAAKQSGGALPEPVDRVGSVPLPPRRAELDPRKSIVGPLGCTQFRSFDPISGTYTTLDGRRRQCRQ